MKEDLFKIANILSDRTRYTIYYFVLNNIDGVSVRNVATEFSIHPNVARLHLTKLEEVGLLRSILYRNPAGGRPNKLFLLSEETISMTLPHKDFSLMNVLAMKTIAKLGPPAWAIYIDEAYQHGRLMGAESRKELDLDERSSLEKVIEGIRLTLEKLGLSPCIDVTEDNKLVFSLLNCTFRTCTQTFTVSLCEAHQAVLRGIFEEFFADLKFKPVDINEDCKINRCSYHLQLMSK